MKHKIGKIAHIVNGIQLIPTHIRSKNKGGTNLEFSNKKACEKYFGGLYDYKEGKTDEYRIEVIEVETITKYIKTGGRGD